jgi:hypothetical protein
MKCKHCGEVIVKREGERWCHASNFMPACPSYTEAEPEEEPKPILKRIELYRGDEGDLMFLHPETERAWIHSGAQSVKGFVGYEYETIPHKIDTRPSRIESTSSRGWIAVSAYLESIEEGSHEVVFPVAFWVMED